MHVQDTEVIKFLDDPFLHNVSVLRNEAENRYDCIIQYNDNWVSSSVNFNITDTELSVASNIESFIAERRGEAREKLKNAVICLQRLLPRPPEQKKDFTECSSVFIPIILYFGQSST